MNKETSNENGFFTCEELDAIYIHANSVKASDHNLTMDIALLKFSMDTINNGSAKRATTELTFFNIAGAAYEVVISVITTATSDDWKIELYKVDKALKDRSDNNVVFTFNGELKDNDDDAAKIASIIKYCATLANIHGLGLCQHKGLIVINNSNEESLIELSGGCFTELESKLTNDLSLISAKLGHYIQNLPGLLDSISLKIFGVELKAMLRTIEDMGIHPQEKIEQ